jgi:hypothetical protein
VPSDGGRRQRREHLRAGLAEGGQVALARHRRACEAGVGPADRQELRAPRQLRAQAWRVHLHQVETVGVDDQIDGRPAGLVGEPLEQEVLDPDAGMVELRLVAGHDEQVGAPGRRRHGHAHPR